MTAVLGFARRTNPVSNSRSILIADDLEAHSSARQDKISVLKDRFAIAVMGVDTMTECLGILAGFESASAYPFPTSVQELSAELCRITHEFIPRLYNEILVPKCAKEDLEKLAQQTSSVVVLDMKEHELYQIEIGKLFPPEIEPTFVPRRLEDNTVHYFAAMSSCRPLDSIGDSDPFDFMAKEIGRGHKKLPSLIGEVGAHVRCHGERHTYTSTFQTTKDCVDQYFKRTPLGYNIRVRDSAVEKGPTTD